MLAKAFDFLHGVRVRASSLSAPTSRTTPIPFTYRGPDGAILSVDCKVKLMKGITAILPHFLAHGLVWWRSLAVDATSTALA